MVHERTTQQKEQRMLQTAVDEMDGARHDKADAAPSEAATKRKMDRAKAKKTARVKFFAAFERGYNELGRG
jgi:hypothetical protein